jgi:hypothetical protein
MYMHQKYPVLICTSETVQHFYQLIQSMHAFCVWLTNVLLRDTCTYNVNHMFLNGIWAKFLDNVH